MARHAGGVVTAGVGVRALTALVLYLSCAMGKPAAAVDVYRWVSPDGVTHFSEVRPPAYTGGVQSMMLTPAPAMSGIPAERYRAMLEVAEEIQAGRIERERLRLERERLTRQPGMQASDASSRARTEPYPYFLFPYFRPLPPPPRVGDRPLPRHMAPPPESARWGPGQQIQTP